MDPNVNLKEQLEFANQIIKAGQDLKTPEKIDSYDAFRLAVLVLALHEWIKKGGFLPEDWQKQ